MFNIKQHIILSLALVATVVVTAQEKAQDTIKTDVINVVKPYTPTISDAFKVKETPSLDDDVTTTKKEVKYNIFSFPVASTFTPAKGKAAVVDKARKVKLFDNYTTLGVGTYTTILGEVYLNHSLGRDESVSAYVGHHSSNGVIDGVLTDDGFSDSKLKVSYTKSNRDYNWNIAGGFQYQTYNWYGLLQPQFNQADADNLDVSHSFYNAHIGGDINFEEGVVSQGNVLFRRFGDNYDSGENRFKTSSILNFVIQDQDISTELFFDYLGGSFDRGYDIISQLNYGNFQLGIAPKFQLKQDDLTIDLGVKAVYLNDTEAKDNKFFIYPNITASYRLVDEILIAYGGIQGGLVQNSYYDFARENPFVSPNLFISPTDQQYNSFVGLKGKLSNIMSYKINGRYIAEKGKALFLNNNITESADQSYTYGNSFGIVYDDVSTFSIAGELNVDVNRNFTLGIKGEYFSYDVKNLSEAWNLPDIKASVFLDYQINEQWFMGANLFYIGERKDQTFVTNNLINPAPVTATLDSYFDTNAHVGYHLNDRFSVYTKANNIIGEEYAKWLNTPVQGIQFLAGGTYKFDF